MKFYPMATPFSVSGNLGSDVFRKMCFIWIKIYTIYCNLDYFFNIYLNMGILVVLKVPVLSLSFEHLWEESMNGKLLAESGLSELFDLTVQ